MIIKQITFGSAGLKKWIKLLIILSFPIVLHAQPTTLEFDKQIVRSDFFSDEYPTYPVCKIEKLEMIDNVADNITPGQCVKKSSDNLMFIGGTCGTGGGSGFDFDAGHADLHQAWIFPIQQKPHTMSINFTTASCPSGWGTNCWSSESSATAGSYVGVNGGAPPSDIVLLSNTRVAYASASDKRATSVWVGTTQYPVESIAHTGTLGTSEVVYSTLSTQLPGTNWQAVRFEFSDGTFAPGGTGTGVQRTADKDLLISYLNLQQFIPSQDNIYPSVKDMIKSGTNVSVVSSDTAKSITISATGGGGDGRFVELDTLPADLSSYVHGQILRVKNPSPGKWYDVSGSSILHSIWIDAEVDSANSNNKGASLVGDKYGNFRTEEGGKPLNIAESPIGRFEIHSGNDTLTVLIKKSALNAPDLAKSTLFVRVYQKPIGERNDELWTGEITKGSELTLENVVYVSYTTSAGSARLLDTDIQYIRFARFFSADPPTDDETSNAVQLQSNKIATEIDPQPAVWARAGKPVPSGTFALSTENANVSKSLEMLVIEITPPSSPEATPSNITFERMGTTYSYARAGSPSAQFGPAPEGSSSLSNDDFYHLVTDSTRIYYSYFSPELILSRTPIKIEISGNEYSTSFNNFSSTTGYLFTSVAVGSSDVPTPTVLTKPINFELVKNEEITFERATDSSSRVYVRKEYQGGLRFVYGIYFADNPFNVSGTDMPASNWILDYRGAKTPTHIVYRGRETPMGSLHASTYYKFTPSPRVGGQHNFFPNINELGPWGVNIKFSDGTYWNDIRTHLFQVGEEATEEVRAQKVLTRPQVNDWLSTKQLVSTPPANPQTGQLIEMLADATFRGGTVLKAQTKTGVGAGTFTGFARASLLSDQSVNLGNINPDNANIGIIASYISTHATPSFRNKVVFTRAVDTYSPTKIVFNGTEYNLTADQTLSDYFIASTLTGSSIEAGKEYYINFEDSGGNKLFADRTLKQGATYRWTGNYWFEEKTGLDATEVDSRIQEWARKPTPTGDLYIPFTLFCKELTSAQYTALSTKTADRGYCVE